MQIKKIEVQGFKSFASRTVIEFPEGVTAIVGPNGSGKSNISDSVRWVLGEQSIKNLRGSKMEDVIFAGTENRKKVGFAEVSLYIDNSDGVLPVDYSEVVVTRRLFRTGESSYLINGSECRLKDVQELFLDTGIGKDGYSLIGQGKIDEIISSKSDDRRTIFEEASGIMKYKVRKEEALKKLEVSNANLERINDILQEVENSLEPLEEKSKKARLYLNIKEKLKNLDVNIFLNDVKENASFLANIDADITVLNDDIKKEEQDALEMEKAKLNLKERFDESASKIEENQTKYYELENSLEKLNSRKNIALSSIENNKAQIDRLDIETKEDKEKIDTLKEEINSKTVKMENLLQNKKKFEDELLDKTSKLDSLMKLLDEKGEYIESLKANILSKEDEIDSINIENSSNLATIASNEKQLLELSKTGNQSTSEIDKITFAKDDIVKTLNQYSAKLSEVLENEKNVKEKEDILQNEKLKLKEKIENITSINMTDSSKLSYLKHLKAENEGYQKSVKAIYEYAKENNISTIYGTVASIVSTDEKYETAIEIALGGYMQNIIVETEKDAKSAIEYLKSSMIGRATFLPLNQIKKVQKEDFKLLSKYDGFIGSALDIVSTDKKYEPVINLALSRCIVVDNLENANNIYSKIKDKIKIVTLDGEIIQPTGSITGGKTQNKSQGIIGRDEKIKKLEENIQKYEKDLKKLNEELEKNQLSLNEILSKKEDILNMKEQINLAIAVNNEKLLGIKKDEQKVLDRRQKLVENKDMLKAEIDRLNNIISENKAKIDKNNEEIDSMKKEVEEYTRYNKENQHELDVLNEDIVNLKISLASFDESSSSIDEMKQKLSEDIEAFENGITRKDNEKREAMLQIVKLNEEIKLIDSEITNSLSFKDEYTKISEELKKSKEDIRQKLDVLEVKMLEGVNRVVKIKEQISKLESKKVKYDLAIDTIKNKMWDEYELTVNSSKEYLSKIEPIKDIQLAKKEAEKYRNDIKALGDVDVSSIEEYEEAKSRYDFMTAQKKDLDETKKKLENLIDNITIIMKDQFSAQFKVINTNFKNTFEKLFGGGKATLRLTDDKDILMSGIEIEAQPPGKKLQNMSLLSGGEKALTAIALLFAILQIKPPPFCILDEIEAALDDVNVARFADYINMYSDKTQFIVITHRKGTMEAAKTVYGVTMEEYGISKLVSMKLK